MKNEVLVLSISPFSLLEAKALIEEMGLAGDATIVKVYHYEHSNDEIDNAEKLLCKCFGFEYCGLIGRVRETSCEYFSRYIRFSTLFSKYVWKKQRAKIFRAVDFDRLKCVIMPYRPYVSDVLITNLFMDDIKIHFVADGYLAGHKPDMYPGDMIYISRLTNLYKYENYNTIYCPDGLEYRMNQFGCAKLLSEETLGKVMLSVRESAFYKENLTRYRRQTKNNTLVILQNLFPRYSDSLEEEVELYARMVAESNIPENSVCYIKFHPRDTDNKKNLMKKVMGQSENIVFIDNDDFGTLPVELMIYDLYIKMIIGISSTSLPVLSNMFNRLKINIFIIGEEKLDSLTIDILDDLGLAPCIFQDKL